jgi:hypothetical protein
LNIWDISGVSVSASCGIIIFQVFQTTAKGGLWISLFPVPTTLQLLMKSGDTRYTNGDKTDGVYVDSAYAVNDVTAIKAFTAP